MVDHKKIVSHNSFGHKHTSFKRSFAFLGGRVVPIVFVVLLGGGGSVATVLGVVGRGCARPAAGGYHHHEERGRAACRPAGGTSY